ncbi:PQQ-binding-like beta-propeller repeat protein [Cellulomonas sp.]|uniref:outer membrane protein assembly factor BamB family protein n=1 Tax=Cellulomonas sp. TaxID=40001 RepID=UPI002810C6B0|nr:PQQ-binding-like beta-propeller repeat protein [Cellulomonas sp.]
MRRGTRDVELVEEPPGADAGGDPGTARPRAGRARRWWAVAGAVAVGLGGLGIAQAVVDARERDRLERALDVAGAVAPLPDALAVRWSPDPHLAPVPGWRDPRTVVAVRTTTDGAQDAVAVDTPSGDVRWSVPLLPAPGERGGATEPAGTRCLATGEHRVVCLAAGAYLVVEGTSSFTTTPTTARLLVLDATTGEVLAEHAARHGDALAHAATRAGDLVVLLGTDPAGTSHVWAVDAEDGRERWATPLPPAEVDVLSGGAGSVGPADVRTLADGTAAVVREDGSVVLLDPEDGRRLRAPLPGTAQAHVVPLPDGRVEVVVPGREHGTVLRAGGDVRVTGSLVAVRVDDGSVPGLLLARDGGHVRAVDARTGEVRWEVAVPLVDAASLLDGRVHLTTPVLLATVDARTGALLWERPREGASFFGVVTDGTLLYEPRRVAGAARRRELVGLDPADGAVRRTVALPSDVTSVQPWAGAVVALGADGPLVLG